MMRWWSNEVFNKRRTVSEDEVFKIKNELILTEDKEIADEIKGLKKYIFRVEVATSHMERICVTGNCEELGSWAIDKLIPLCREKDSNRWFGEALIPIKEKVHYAYVIITDVNYQQDSPPTIKSVRRWEAGNPPRIAVFRDDLSQFGFSTKINYLSMTGDEVRSIAVNKFRPGDIDKFGFVDGQSCCVNGCWLTTDSVFQIKSFENHRRFFAKELKNRSILTKFRTVKLESGGFENEDFCEERNPGWPAVEISVLDEKRQHFTRQDSFGTPLCQGDNAIVHIFHDRPLSTGIVLDFFCTDQRLNKMMHVGFACVHPCTLSRFEGELNLDITNVNNQPVGDIKIEYLTIHHAITHKYDLNGSMRNLWEKLWTAIDDQPQEGTYERRSNIKICSETRNNTLASIKETIADGTDFVELSVQMTKDGIPVFAHNPYIVAVIKNPDEIIPLAQYQVNVNKFTLPQLQRMKVHSVEKCDDFLKLPGINNPQDFNNVPFPTLTHLLNGVDKNVGFVIDVCTISIMDSGTYPNYHDHDLNEDLDKILKTLHQSAGRRIIVLVSFLPDVCSMLRIKQNVYPVIFLREGIPERYAPYNRDVRCNNFEIAVDFAVGIGISGIGTSRHNLMTDYNAYKIQKSNLISMVVDDFTDDQELRQHMNQWKLDGFLCRRHDRFGLFRRTFAYLLEPKDKELCFIQEWAEDAERDGITKPRIHPLKTAHPLFPELTMKSQNDAHRSAPVLPLNSNLSMLKSDEYVKRDKPFDLSDQN